MDTGYGIRQYGWNSKGSIAPKGVRDKISLWLLMVLGKIKYNDQRRTSVRPRKGAGAEGGYR